MQLRPRTMVLMGVSVAMLGALLVFGYGRSMAGRVGGGSASSAFVATKDIGPGTTWEAARIAVKSQSVPESLQPASAITSEAQLAGTTSVRRITKGEVVTTAQFGRSSAAPGAGLEIPPKHNAVTINVPPPRGVAHYPQPGDLVNAYTTIKGADGKTMTKLLLANIQVLSNRTAGAQANENVASGGEVLLTLALTPDKTEKLIFAKENGSMWFGLVHPGDGPATTVGRTTNNLLGE